MLQSYKKYLRYTNVSAAFFDDSLRQTFPLIFRTMGQKLKISSEKFGSEGKNAYLCSVKGEANRRQTESNQARLNCRGAKEEGEAK